MSNNLIIKNLIESINYLDSIPKVPSPIKIVENEYLAPRWKQIKFPKSKKKRIKLKFKKNSKNYGWVEDLGYYDKLNNIIYLPSKAFNKYIQSNKTLQ
jgi:hypothetical protein